MQPCEQFDSQVMGLAHPAPFRILGRIVSRWVHPCFFIPCAFTPFPPKYFSCINSLGHRTVFEGVDDETVVFVLGDHGMTEDGNHGGATPEETGAALLVWSRSGERLLGPGFNRRNSGGAASSSGRDKRSGDTGDSASPETLAGADGGSTDRRQGHGDVAPAGEKGSEGHPRPVPAGRRVAQIDLVPTISLLLGTPIPFGSLGGVIPEVFSGPYLDGGESGDDERGPRYLERLCDALLVNSVQVGGGGGGDATNGTG